MVHERWQRAAAAAGALMGLVVAAWLLLSTPAPGARPPARPGTSAALPVADWCGAAGDGIAAAVDDVVLAPGWPGAEADAEAVADLTGSWSMLLTAGAEERAWGSARSVPTPIERAAVVRQLQVVRDALVEAAASGRVAVVRAEASALDDLLQPWC